MAHWSQNPFWADEDIFASSSTNPASNQKKEKKKEPAKRGKASSKSSAPPPAASVAPRDLFACGSDTEPEEPIPATQPSAVKRKRAVFPDSEDEATNVVPGKCSRAAVPATQLRSFFTQRTASGYSTQRDPLKRGEYFIELRVYNTAEAEKLQDEKWRHPILAIKVGADTNSSVWRATSRLVQATREDFAHIQPIIYPNCYSY
ncbi:hypothetical protein JYU34_003060 [Plutella xylostella]|uniref:Uncharacterized protein n=1 Tax=Plutella xylostella TaxID=51655 RepID=A0ABQ7QZ58_PLUXY|nr:uncharacterized protein LOC105385439 isoform X2 [Plutella xylostella]XP_048479348.1 uncharacterized protein LOC125489038 isoform X2 [Plutella xylostella]XP_048486157.1 uncharacterized protein LOC125488538 isoform X2 [Plutella xylostella]KAG7310305.1 hypothetical protein JYU34_003060 [Plutella xylostella]